MNFFNLTLQDTHLLDLSHRGPFASTLSGSVSGVPAGKALWVSANLANLSQQVTSNYTANFDAPTDLLAWVTSPDAYDDNSGPLPDSLEMLVRRGFSGSATSNIVYPTDGFTSCIQRTQDLPGSSALTAKVSFYTGPAGAKLPVSASGNQVAFLSPPNSFFESGDSLEFEFNDDNKVAVYRAYDPANLGSMEFGPNLTATATPQGSGYNVSFTTHPIYTMYEIWFTIGGSQAYLSPNWIASKGSNSYVAAEIPIAGFRAATDDFGANVLFIGHKVNESAADAMRDRSTFTNVQPASKSGTQLMRFRTAVQAAP